MELTDNLPLYGHDYSGLFLNPSGLEQTLKLDASLSQPTYQGRRVQALDIFPAYHSPPDIHQNDTDPVNFLDEYVITPLTTVDPVDFSGANTAEIQQSILDGYAPWDYGHADFDELPSIPDICSTHQACLSGCEPWIREPIPSVHSALDNLLTQLSVTLANPQGVPSLMVANPLNLNQMTSDNHTTLPEQIADGNASTVEKKGKAEVSATGRTKESFAMIPVTKIS